MGAVILKRIFISTFFVAVIVIQLASCGNGTSTALSCTATATLISGTEYENLVVTMTNGTEPYTLSLPITGDTSVQSTSTTYSYSTTFTATSTVISVNDSANNSTTCSINGDSTTSGTTGSLAVTGNISVTGTPNPPVLGTPLTLTATDQLGITDPTFSFTLESSVAGVSITGGGASAVILNTYEPAIVVMVYEYVSGSSTPSATATVTLSYSGGVSTIAGTSPTMIGSISCTLYNYGSSSATYYPNQQIDFTIEASTGEAVEVYELIPGSEAWSAGFTNIPSVTNEWAVPFELSFTTTGQQNIEVWAQSISRPGYLCNSGQPLTGVITIE